jgi:protein-disulfide isomerase
MPEIIKNYVDTGKLKIVFKDFSFLGNDSITGGEYSHAIWELYPGQWYAWRVAMLKAQDQEGDQGFGNAATIDSLIKKQFPQMDDAKIKQQIANKKDQYDGAMAADRSEGSTFGVQGTPGFIIGKTLIPGAAAYATFKAALDSVVK